MRAALALTAFLAFVPNANAAMTGGDNNKQLTVNAELRTRYTYEDNQSGSNSIQPNNGNTVEERLAIGGTYRVSEKFGVTAKFMDSFMWGSQDLGVYNANGTPSALSSGDGNAIHNGASSNNLLMVQEAYGYWMMSDDLIFRFGRGSLQMGDGAVIGTNDYDPVPNAFDGVMGSYEFDFGRISAWVVKFATYDNGLSGAMLSAGSGGHAAYITSGDTESDPEADAYGLSFDLKRMPEWLKMFNAHVIQTTKATTPGAAVIAGLMADPLSAMGQNTTRFGIAVGGAAAMIDYKLDAEGVTGKYFCSGAFATGCAGSGAPDQGFNTNQYMAQLELGVNFPDFMKARIFGRVHLDSGDSDTAVNATKVSTYDAYYYNKYEGGGMMQVVDWGNLTFYNFGLTVQPGDQTTFGVQWFMFQKTHEDGSMNPGRYGDMVMFTSPNSSGLGQEIDLWGEHKYDGGFTILAHVGMFMPGSSVKDGMTQGLPPQYAGIFPAGVSRDSTFYQAMVQGKMSF